MKINLIAFTFFAFFSGSLIAEEIPVRYVIQEGVMSGLPNQSAVTIMLDTYTGRSWMLGVLDGKPQWLPLTFNEKVPEHIIPTPIKIPNSKQGKMSDSDGKDS
jgi:hypothetical protein